jgi:hypothetical protein
MKIRRGHSANNRIAIYTRAIQTRDFFAKFPIAILRRDSPERCLTPGTSSSPNLSRISYSAPSCAEHRVSGSPTAACRSVDIKHRLWFWRRRTARRTGRPARTGQRRRRHSRRTFLASKCLRERWCLQILQHSWIGCASPDSGSPSAPTPASRKKSPQITSHPFPIMTPEAVAEKHRVLRMITAHEHIQNAIGQY